MRVRLDIARHELPSVKILWNVAPEAITISKLLEQIHDAIPLESDGWGIEDYAVEVNGYEALHYLNPHIILHEEDQVTIRALQTPDIRVRSVSGRYQIAASGAHLIDGIAFGKAYLKRPSRPPVHIPPRKRPRLSHDYYDENEDFTSDDEHQTERLRIEDDIEDGDKELQEPDIGDDDTTPGFASVELPSTGLLRSGKSRKSVTFDESSLSAAHDEDDEVEDEEDYEPDGDDASDSDDDGEDLKGADVADEAPTKAKKPSESVKRLANRTHKSETPISHGPRASKDILASPDSSSTSSDSSDNDSVSSQASTSDDDSDSSDSSDSDSDSDSSEAEPEIASTKPSKSVRKAHQLATNASAAPGEGRRSTRARNMRRSKSKKLNHLKRTGKIGPDTTLAQLSAGILKPIESQQDKIEMGETEFTRRRNELLESLEAGGVDKDSLATIGPQAYPSLQAVSSETQIVPPNSSQMPPRLVESVTNLSNVIENSSPRVQLMETLTQTQDSTSQTQAQNIKDEVVRQADARKSRSTLDLASSNRLIFGSLGVRTPRTKADEDKVRARLGGKTKSIPARRKSEEAKEKADPLVQEQAEVVAQDSNAWRKKIKLMAIECLTPEIGGKPLSTPPFPFKQGWDASASMKGKKRKRSNQRFFKGEPREGEPVNPLPCYLEGKEAEERAENEFDYSFGEGLNYDDITEDLPERDSLVKDSQEDDLPDLPTSMADLPALIHANALPGTIIAFKQFEVSEATKWQPGMSGYKTAEIINFDEGSSIVRLQLAKRDNPHWNREYDWKGNPIYGKFEMAADEDDTLAADGILELDFVDLGEPKLVRAAALQSNMIAEPADASSVQDNVETIRVPDSMLDPHTQNGFHTVSLPSSEAENLGPTTTQPESHTSEQSIAPSTSTAGPYAEKDLWDTPQARSRSPSYFKSTSQTSLSVAPTESQQQSSTSQTMNYDELRSEDSQRSPSCASATESGSHDARGLVLEASA